MRAATPEGDRLDLLVTLAEAYEAKHAAVRLPDPIEVILFMIKQKVLSRRDLELAIGSWARVAKALNRLASAAVTDDTDLSLLLELPADVLVPTYPLADPAG
jgi:HTH-type transcriptional regulator / antitoxin HigA